MTETKQYLFHELSSYLPLLEGEEFNDLVEDIKQHGQIEPVTLYEGKILDGRNRYRACKILKQELITREWKPSKATGSTPLQYVISENIMRRHLNEAQKGEIGMLLYEEVEKQVEKERRKKQAETQRGVSKKDLLIEKSIKDPKEYKIEDTTAYKVAQKVRVKPTTIVRVKKIKEAIAKDDKEIAEEWEKAKKGDSTITAVYQEALEKDIIETLPEDLKVEVKKEKAKVKKAKKEKNTYKPKITARKAQAIKELPIDVRKAVVHSKAEITIEDAKSIAEIPNETLRKQEVAERERVKERQLSEVKKKKDLAEGKIIPKPKFFDKDVSKIETVRNICKNAVETLTVAGLEGYGNLARKECIKMMKILFEHLRKELKKAGEVAPKKVIEIGTD